MMSPSNRPFTRRLSLVGVAVLLCAASSCTPLALSPAPFVAALHKQGWTYSDPPRGLLGPGAIVSVSKESGITYRGAIASCIDDPDVTRVVQAPVAVSGTMSGNTSFDISVLASYQDISVGPEFKKLKSFTLTLGDTVEEALDSIKIKDWIQSHRDTLTDACLDALVGNPREVRTLDNGIYVLTDVLRVTGYRYTFHGESDTKIALSPANIGEYVKLQGNLSYTATNDGDLRVDSPVYFAFKQDVSAWASGGAGAGPAGSAVQVMEARNAQKFGPGG